MLGYTSYNSNRVLPQILDITVIIYTLVELRNSKKYLAIHFSLSFNWDWIVKNISIAAILTGGSLSYNNS